MATGRRLREDELSLIKAMLSEKPSHAELLSSVHAQIVEDMNDGGMGGIRFFSPDKARTLGAAIAEAEYCDDDGVLVSIVVNTDASGRLYEVDFWKVNFLPLRRYPSPQDLRIK